MTGVSFTGLIVLVAIMFIISYNLLLEPFEPFVTDISSNRRQVIYDTVPYASSGLFYDYIIGSPYYYNPLDYWLNPYFYYSWYNPSYSTSSSIPYVKKVRHHTRRTRRFV